MQAMPPSSRCRIRRLPDRANYDGAAIREIIDAAFLCHIAIHTPDGPHCLPTACWREADHLHIHGAANSRLVAVLQKEECAVCISHLDGLVLARSAFHHSMNYRSVVIYGRFETIDSEAGKRRALAAFLEHVSPGRSRSVRPPSPAELAGTVVLRLPLAEAAAKVRNWGVQDSPEDLAIPAWAGVIPLRLAAGAAIPEADCGPFEAPGLAAALA